MLNRIRIVLVNPSHPGNIGAAARAMKNMGLSQLVLVAPQQFPHHEATARAAGADDILARAEVCNDLTTALTGCHLTYALSARARRLPWPSCDPRQCAEQITQQADTDRLVALVFGRESSGLTNDELMQCQQHVFIPCNPEFSSLNLASAVQIIAYELYQQTLLSLPASSPVPLAAGSLITPLAANHNEQEVLATAEQMQGFFQHLQQTLTRLEVLDPNHPRMLMHRLQRLFNRAQLNEVELNILRGFLKAINKHLSVI